MKINHIAMYVTDLEVCKKFFIDFFEGKASELYQNQKTGFNSYFIDFEDNTRLEIMNKPGLNNQPKEQNRTGYIHLAFSVGSKSKVDSLTYILKENGYEIISGPRTTGDGYYESCIVGPENNLIEITI